MIVESGAISELRGRELLDAGEMVAAADGSETVESMTSLGALGSTADDGSETVESITSLGALQPTADDGSEAVGFMTSLGVLESTAGGDFKIGAEDTSSCCCGTGDSKALVVDGDDELPGSEDGCCWGSISG